MKFKSFYEETLSSDGGHKHLSLEQSAMLKAEVTKEFSGKIKPEHADDIIAYLVRRYEEKWLLLRERKMSNIQAERFLDRKGFIRPPGWHSVFFYPDSFLLRTPYLAIALAIIATAAYSHF